MLPVLLWAGLVVTKMFSQFLVRFRVTPAPAPGTQQSILAVQSWRRKMVMCGGMED